MRAKSSPEDAEIFRIRRCKHCGELAEVIHRRGPGAHKFYQDVCNPCRELLRVKRQRAITEVAKAIKKGILQRPKTCERCHSTPGPMSDGRTQIEAHHAYGYDQPLKVQWVCHRCNQQMKGPEFHSYK